MNDQLINELIWVAELDDVDHDICDAARQALDVIRQQEQLIELLAENERKLREELDEIKGIIR